MTKLRPPRARSTLVARQRLLDALAARDGHSLTLLSAPAGFGKTTLLNQWLQVRADTEPPVAWLSLDEGDNDPARFLSSFLAALGTVDQGLGKAILASLRSPEPPRIEVLVGTLVNELATRPADLVVILDDYHVIESPAVHGIVSSVLDRLPEGVHLIVASRMDPPLPLARLRARGQMVRIGAADLRFTLAEAAAFLHDVMGLELPARDVTALEERTEGWAAGLQLAALSMRDRADVSGFVAAFSGNHRDVVDFLAEEVLNRQPPDVQRFLLATSILDRLAGPLCDAVAPGHGGQEMLERLERANLFVVALDDERRWYRYHHLFADFLRTRLERGSPERTQEIHRAAATWCEIHGLVDAAVRHALEAGDPAWAARLIERHVTEVFARNEHATARRWLERLPGDVLRSRPRLCLARAYQAMAGGRLDELEQQLDDAERAVAVDGGDDRDAEPPAEAGWAADFLADVPGTVAVLRAAHARLRGDARRMVEQAALAKARVPAGHFVSVLADWELARAQWMFGDLASAQRALRGQLAEAVAARRAAEQPYRVVVVSWDLGRVQRARGRLRSALRTYRGALELATIAGPTSTPVAGIAHVGLADVLCERDDLDAALEHAETGVEACGALANRMPLAAGLATLARIRQALGDPDGALAAIREAERVGLNPAMTDLFNPVPVQRARLLLAQGNVAEVADWIAGRQLDVEDPPTYAGEGERLVLARLLLAQNDPDRARRLLERTLEHAEQFDRTGSVIEILALQALALRAAGEHKRAVDALSRALELGQPESYIRTFVDEGRPMAGLLAEVRSAPQRQHLSRSISPLYLAKLLAAIQQGRSDLATAGTGLAEPLSERELEVLALVAVGTRNHEIADELVIALSTVKTHVKSIYRKLGARNRAQAVTRARELGLL